MSHPTEQAEHQSHIRFQMWDKYLTLLNHIWDLEQPGGVSFGPNPPEQPATNFHTTFWDQHLLKLNQAWHVSATLALVPPTSWVGKILFPLKNLILRWIQPSIDALIQQQNDLNAQVVQTCNGLVEAVNKDMLHTIYKLESQKEFNARLVQALNGFVELAADECQEIRAELQKRFQELQMMMWTFDRYKEALEIDEVLLNQKLERILALLRTAPRPIAEETTSQLPAPERQEDYAYVRFENFYRGDEATIKQRQAGYLPYFQNCTNVLDIGCGRGEFLELLQAQQISGYGVDLNQNMIQYCRQKGLRAEEADIFAHLAALPDNSLGGIFAAQVVEHCAPKDLYRLLQLCFAKLQFQKYLIFETQNPKSLYVLSYFYRDISHDKPIHPDALCNLVKLAGFQEIHVEYKNRLSKAEMLQELEATDGMFAERFATLNDNIRRLNDLVYGDLDYAVIAKKVNIF